VTNATLPRIVVSIAINYPLINCSKKRESTHRGFGAHYDDKTTAYQIMHRGPHPCQLATSA